jgi:hypothetical protein
MHYHNNRSDLFQNKTSSKINPYSLENQKLNRSCTRSLVYVNYEMHQPEWIVMAMADQQVGVINANVCF